MTPEEKKAKLQELVDLYSQQGDVERAAQINVQLNQLVRSMGPGRPQGATNLPNVPNIALKIPGTDIEYVNNPEGGEGGYGGGLVAMGAGVDRLVTGAKDLALQVGGRVAPPYMVDEARGRLNEDYQRRRETYAPLREELGGPASLGEMAGETAPFVGAPIPRIARGGVVALDATSGLLARGADYIGRMMPEFLAGGTESALPLPEEGETRTGNLIAGGASAAGMKGVTDLWSRRANAARGLYAEPHLQDLADLANDAGIPNRRGTLKDQLEKAGEFAAGYSSGRMPGEVGQDIVEGAQAGVEATKKDFQTAYGMLFGAMDRYGADTQSLVPKLQQILSKEQARGSHRSDALIGEIEKWIKTPDMAQGLTVEKLHQFRHTLRQRMDSLDPAEISRMDSWKELERTVGDHIAQQADAIHPGFGQTLKDLDTWYYEDLAKLRRAPGVQAALGENPTPSAVASWFTSSPTPFKRQLFDQMTPTGKNAVIESIWNNAYTQAGRKKEFDPLRYAQYVEKTSETAGQYMNPQDLEAFTNAGRLMRHIATNGRTADIRFLDLVRGYPFVFKKGAEAIRKANWRWRLSQAPDDIKPGSPQMENFYRGILRSLAIQDLTDLGEATGDTFGQAYEVVTPPYRMGYGE
jgi:hypothetical protein